MRRCSMDGNPEDAARFGVRPSGAWGFVGGGKENYIAIVSTEYFLPGSVRQLISFAQPFFRYVFSTGPGPGNDEFPRDYF